MLRRLALLGSGLVSLFALSSVIAVLVTGVSLRGGIGSEEFRPTALAQLHSSYRAGIGNLTLDLGALSFPDHSVRVDASVAIGHLIVELPNGAQVSL